MAMDLSDLLLLLFYVPGISGMVGRQLRKNIILIVLKSLNWGI